MTITDPTTVPPEQTAWRNTAAAGDRIAFTGEPVPFTVVGVAAGGRFLICHLPADGDLPALWCLVDFNRGVRGPDDHYGLRGYDTPEGVAAMIEALETGQVQVSYRNNVVLDIARVGEPRG